MRITMDTINFLSGLKTYILAGLLMINSILYFGFHLIDQDTASAIAGALLPLLAFTIRQGIKSDAEKVAVRVKQELQDSNAEIVETVMQETFEAKNETKRVAEDVKREVNEVKAQVQKEVASIKNGGSNLG